MEGTQPSTAGGDGAPTARNLQEVNFSAIFGPPLQRGQGLPRLRVGWWSNASQRRHASWLPPRKLILHSILGIAIPIPVPRITGASLAPGTATIGDGALRVPSESTGMVAIPLEPRVS